MTTSSPSAANVVISDVSHTDVVGVDVNVADVKQQHNDYSLRSKQTTAKVRVSIRVRPSNARESTMKTVVEVLPCNTSVMLHSSVPATSVMSPTRKTSSPCKQQQQQQLQQQQHRQFTFDHCFGPTSTQADVYDAMGLPVLHNMFEGYNGCVFAYGQTGTGKSHTMMGVMDASNGTVAAGDDLSLGLIPRLCRDLFDKCASSRVEASYLEIYNEHVHDLLATTKPGTLSGKLRVREHSTLGPYVEGLNTLAVVSYDDIAALLDGGNKARTVAATNMNASSSRSHAVFTLTLLQDNVGLDGVSKGGRVSKVSLVDLAGSERQKKTHAENIRLKESGKINKSLTTLGLCISKLAERKKNSNHDDFIPYRDSTLTYLLKESLGGNSITTMIATMSPADDNYEETLSTLRFADRAKRIENVAVVNEDASAAAISELREELTRLRERLSARDANDHALAREMLAEREALMANVTRTWEEKLALSEAAHRDRQRSLQKIGVSILDTGITVDKKLPFLVNLNEDPSMNENLVYYLTRERTGFGQSSEADVMLQGLGIDHCHCTIISKDGPNFFLCSHGESKTLVDGIRCIPEEETKLWHNSRILMGQNHLFRFNCSDARRPVTVTALSTGLDGCADDCPTTEEAKQLPLVDDMKEDSEVTLTSEQKQHLLDTSVMCREANAISQALRKNVTYRVFLQISMETLLSVGADFKLPLVGSYVEVAVQVCNRKHRAVHIWSPEQLKERLLLMRDFYGHVIADQTECEDEDPFFDAYEQRLIGVAYISMAPLRHPGIPVDITTAIVDQLGVTRGTLTVHMQRQIRDGDGEEGSNEKSMNFQILRAEGIQKNLSSHCFCRFTLSGNEQVYAAKANENLISNAPQSSSSHVPAFLRSTSDASLSEPATTLVTFENDRCAFSISSVAGSKVLIVEVFGSLLLEGPTTPISRPRAESAPSPVHIDEGHCVCLAVSMLEPDQRGNFVSVEITTPPDVSTGGLFLLRQNFVRRMRITVESKDRLIDAIQWVRFGNVRLGNEAWQNSQGSVRIDSFSDRNGTKIISRQRARLNRRRLSLRRDLDAVEHDEEKSAFLIKAWIQLLNQRSRFETAISNEFVELQKKSKPPGYEDAVSRILLDGEGENKCDDDFIDMRILTRSENSVEVGWDSSLYDSPLLQRITGKNERIYVSVAVGVSVVGYAMPLVLRKEVCVRIVAAPKPNLLNKIFGGNSKTSMPLTGCGAMFFVYLPDFEVDDDSSDDDPGDIIDAVTYASLTKFHQHARHLVDFKNILTRERLKQDFFLEESIHDHGLKRFSK